MSAKIAAAVAETAYGAGLATAPRAADLLAHVRGQMWEPVYGGYVAD